MAGTSQTEAPLMVTISGIRGIWGKSLTPTVCSRYIMAFLELLKRHHPMSESNEIILGSDSRESRIEICTLASNLMVKEGYHVTYVGIVPTPTVQHAVLERKAVAGLIVTASHNPIGWNGLKFVDSDSLFLSPERCSEMFGMADRIVPIVDVTRALPKEDAGPGNAHVESVLSLPYVHGFGKSGFRPTVAVDAICGAGYRLLPQLLECLGCDVRGMNMEPSGRFPRMPEPIETNLREFGAFVAKSKADFGLAVDPDADRLVILDERGHCICEELTLTIAVDYLLNRWHGELPAEATAGRKLTIVKNLSTTRAVDEVVARYNAASALSTPSGRPPLAHVLTTAVGEINVAKMMQAERALIGGEGNGGVMLPACHIGRDSLVGAGLFLSWVASHMSEDKKPPVLSDLVKTLPAWTIVKGKLEMSREEASGALAKLEEEYRGKLGFAVSTLDGVRIDAKEWWVHVRGSNTEPIVRIIGEARTGEEAERLVDRWTGVLRQSIKVAS